MLMLTSLLTLPLELALSTSMQTNNCLLVTKRGLHLDKNWKKRLVTYLTGTGVSRHFVHMDPQPAFFAWYYGLLLLWAPELLKRLRQLGLLWVGDVRTYGAQVWPQWTLLTKII